MNNLFTTLFPTSTSGCYYPRVWVGIWSAAHLVPLFLPLMSRTFPVLLSRMTSFTTSQRAILSPNGFKTILFPPSVTGRGCTIYNYYQIRWWTNTVYPKKYPHGFVVLCFVVGMQSFIKNSHEVFIQIHQGCFAGTGAIVKLPQCQWSKPDGYGEISQCITTTKQKPCAYLLGYTVHPHA